MSLTISAKDMKPKFFKMAPIHSVETPSKVDPSGIYCIEGPSELSTQSADWLWVGDSLCLLWDYLCLLYP